MPTPIFPPEAGPVIKILRRDVPRPKRRPRPTGYSNCARLYRWDARCPMGLHPQAKLSTPLYQIDLPVVEQEAIESFYNAWDSLKADQLDAALDEIWGPKP